MLRRGVVIPQGRDRADGRVRDSAEVGSDWCRWPDVMDERVFNGEDGSCGARGVRLRR